MGSRADLGRALADFRTEKGLSQSALAELVGEDRAWVARNEAGARRVDAVELTRIAMALGVGLDEILDRAKLEHRPPDRSGGADV